MHIDSMGSNKNICKSELHDRRISFAIIIQLCMLITNYTFKQVLNINDPSNREIISAVFMLLVGVIFLINIPIVIKRIGRIFVGTYLFSASVFLLNILFFSQNVEYIANIAFYFFLICLPTFLYYLAINNKEILHQMIIKSAYYQMALGIIFFIASTKSDYDMVYSYLILVPVIMLLYKVYQQFNLLDCTFIIFGLYSILAIGSRGPFLSIIFYYTILFLVDMLKRKNQLKSIAISLVCISAVFLFYTFLNEILYAFSNYYEINSRTIYILLNENVEFSSGRLDIYKLTLEEILNKPMLGHGLAGDRVFLNGTYPHNIFLEVLAQFGIIIGFFIIITFIFYWFNGIVLNNNKKERDLAIMFFGIGLVQLFVSGSYLTSSNFWLFMAICISSVHFRKGKSRLG